MNSFRGPILCSPEWALKVGFRTYTHINHLVSTHWYGILSHHVLLPSSKVCAGQVMPCALWGLPRLPHTLVSNLSPMILAQCHKNCTSTQKVQYLQVNTKIFQKFTLNHKKKHVPYSRTTLFKPPSNSYRFLTLRVATILNFGIAHCLLNISGAQSTYLAS